MNTLDEIETGFKRGELNMFMANQITSLLQQIKTDSVVARKEKQSYATFLVTLYSECANVGKNKGNRLTTDEECLSIIKKFKAGIIEIITIYQQKNELSQSEQNNLDKANIELSLIDKYIPKQLSEEELKLIIISEIELGADNIGKIMKSLKQSYSGRYDGNMAQKIIKELL
ncbi:MAG: GatB/YqeY domain-containing protein [Flavobacterium sp.]|uniref:GatB/YqeY domain-containing protein n=1 Tax=Flavobacterium sp. TaxID=239 RepID=UPI0026125964|nr:GatB/YqeY domain-containing protein [Flavobacterium sp.]MDD5150420.1 GatB/YqeY domain-containing protein [Flavobacterium sp.]